MAVASVRGAWADLQGSPSFYPARPANAKVLNAVGVLTSYGRGTHAGSLLIKVSGGAVRGFYIGSPLTINGAPVWCGVPPTAGRPADPLLCPDWPSAVVIGSTTVKVLYWSATRDGKNVWVVDTITSI